MNNEIKEILDFKENADYKKLSCDEIKVLRDYITNLQQENERLKQNNMSYQEEMARTWKITDDYKSRIEKAVEYIENDTFKSCIWVGDRYQPLL